MKHFLWKAPKVGYRSRSWGVYIALLLGFFTSFTQEGLAQTPYCASSAPLLQRTCGAGTGPALNRVSVNGVAGTTTGCSGNTSFDDFTGSSSFAFSACAGGTATISLDLTFNTAVNAVRQIGVWIDFNGDGDWSDTGEFQALTTASIGAAPSTQTVSFPIPTGISGNRRMRIRLLTNGAGVNSPLLQTDACTDFNTPTAGNVGRGETEDYTVNITSSPTISVTTNSPVCVGATLMLTATQIAGATYTFTTPAATTIGPQASNEVSVTAVQATHNGNWTVAATVPSGCPVATVTVPVVVNALPTAPTVSTNTPVCSGGTLILTASATISGASYAWTGPNNYSQSFIGTGGTVSFNLTSFGAVNAGDYSLTVTQSDCSSTATTTVALGTQPTAPPVTSSSPVCVGGTLSLTATNTNGAVEIYTWTGPNSYSTTFTGNFSSVTSSITNVTAANAGVYSLSYTRNGCTSAVSIVTVTVNPTPTATLINSSPSCVGGNVVLIAAPVSGATYVFTGPDGTNYNTGASNFLVRAGVATATDNGTWTVTVTRATCTASASSLVTINSAPTATFNVTTPTCADTPQSISFTGTASSTATYVWSFGVNAVPSAASGVGPHSVQWTSGGNKSLTLTVTDPGCPSVTSAAVTVVVRGPITAPTVAATSPVVVCPNNGTFTIPITNPNGGAVATTLNITGPNGFSFSTALANGASTNFTEANLPGGIITELNEGLYSATLSRAQAPGCTSSVATFTIIVEDPITVTAANSGPVCDAGAGANVTFTATPLVSGANYTFTSPSGTATGPGTANVATIAVFSGTDDGVWQVDYISANGCVSSANTTLVINTPPTATASNGGAICEGGTISLFAETVTGATYAWTGPNGFTSSEQNPTRANAVAATDAGDYSLTVTLNGCASTPAVTTTVTINPTVAFTALSNSPVCVGGTQQVTLIPTSTGAVTPAGTQFTFLSTANAILDGPTASNTVVSTLTAGSFGDLFTGTYGVIVEVPGCTAYTIPVPFTVLESPTATFTALPPTVCIGESATIQYTGNAKPGATYTWNCDGCNEVLNGPGPHIVTWSTSGVKNPSLTVQNSEVDFNGAPCNSTTFTQQVTVSAAPATPAVTSNTPVCVGSTLDLTATTTVNGADYVWTGPNYQQSFVGNGSDVTFFLSNATAAFGGTYTLTISQSGCTSFSTTDVVVNPVPTASFTLSRTATCVSSVSPIIATYTGTGGTTFTWNCDGCDGGPVGVSVEAFLYSTSGTGSKFITLTVADGNGCTASAPAQMITVKTDPNLTIGNNGPLCAGETLFLTASGDPNYPGLLYTWSEPVSGFNSALQNPSVLNVTAANAGTYTLNLFDPQSDCSVVPLTTTVTVNALPIPTPTNNTPICAGATINLVETTGGFSQWMWTGPGGFASVNQNPNIANATTANAGTYTVSVIDVNGCESLPVSTEVIVNAGFTATLTNNGPVCDGANVTFVATPLLAGANYTFTSPLGVANGPFTANTFINAVFAGTDDGVWTVDVTDVNGCASNSAQSTLVINQSPIAIATNGGAVCIGGTLSLFAETVTGGSYAWSGPNGFTSAEQNPMRANITAADAGDYSLTVTQNGCVSTQVTTTVTVNALPIPTPTSNSPICAGSALNLMETTGGFSQWMWSGPNGFTSANQNPNIANTTAANAGTYTVSVIDANGCMSLPVSTEVIVNTTVSVNLTNSGPVCENSPLTLTATQIPGATYTFTDPLGNVSNINANTLSIFAAALTDGGDWTVSATLGTCVSATAVSNVVVNPSPAAPTLATAGSVFFCEGDVANNPLTLDPGVTTVGAFYTLTGPNNYIATFTGDGSGFQQQFIVNPTTANSGTYFLSVNLNGCTAQTASLQVTINPIPPVGLTVSDTEVCAGEVVIFTQNDPQNLGYSYTFFDGSAGVFGSYGPYTATYPTASSQQIFTASYFVFDTFTSCFDFVSIPIIVNPQPIAPTVTSNTPVCSGTNLTLTVNNSELNATHLITGPNGYSFTFVGTGANFPVTIANAQAANAGAYTVSVMQNGCEGPSTTTTVVVNQTPSATFTAVPAGVCQNAPVTVTYTGTPVAGATYAWTFTNGTPASANTLGPHTVTYAAATGAQTLSLTVANGACNATFTQSVTVTAVPATPTFGAFTAICEGSTITITTVAAAIAGATYNWSGPGGFTSQTVGVNTISRLNATPAMSGLYSLTITQNGCTSGLATTNVTVNPVPTAVLTTNSPVCAGQQLLVTATTNLNATAGVPITFNVTLPGGGPAVPFTITTGNSVALVLNNSTTASTGSWLLSVSRAGCTSATVQVAVVINPIPTVTANNSGPVCPGASVQLFASNVLNGQYQWSGPGGFSSMVQNPVIASAVAGTYSVTVTQNGCTSAQATTTVALNAVPATPTLNAVAALCEGQTITVSTVAAAIAGATYSWSGPGGFTSVTIGSNSITRTNATLAMSGLYSLTVTQNGCVSALATAQVTVNPTPVALLTNSSPVCVGSPLTLTATSIPGAQYTFTAPNAATFGPQSSNVVNVAAATAAIGGTWSVTATLGTCVSAIATSTVSVTATPASPTPVSAAQTVCLGGTLNLTSSAVANATYQWLGPNGYTSNQQNPVKTGMTLADAGIYSVRVTVSGCTSAFATVTVTVTSLLSITLSNTGPVCSGTALTLTATAGGTSYSFTSPTGTITTQASNTLNIASANATHNGVWTVTATSATCVSNPASTTVVVNTTPATPTPNSNTPICVGATLQLFAPTVAGATYAWSGPSAFSSSVANPVRNSATAAMGGIYSLIVTVNGCPSAQATHTVTVNATPAPPNASTLAPTVCVGDVIDLVAGPLLTTGATYTWNGPNDYEQSFVAASAGPFTFSIFNVTQANSGVYSLKVTSNGCTSLPTTVQVTVNETPSSQYTPSAFTVCGGETVVFTINTPDPNNFYFFDDAQGNSFAGTGPFVVTYSNISPSQIYSTFLDAFDPTFTCGSTTVIPITVNPAPAAPSVSSNTPVCSGSGITLTVSGTLNGATYNVTGPNGYSFTFAGTGGSQNVLINNATAANAGSYTVSVIDNGCESPATSVQVDITTTPEAFFITAPTTACVGQPVTISYSGTPTPGATYSWFFVGGTPNSASTLGPHVVSWNSAGSQTVQLVVFNGVCFGFFNQTVTVTAVPTTPTLNAVTALCEGGTITVSTAAAAIAGATYNWSGPGGFTSQTLGVNSITRLNATPAMSGLYSLTITQNGCTSALATTNVQVNPVPSAVLTTNSPVCAGQQLLITAATNVNASVAIPITFNVSPPGSAAIPFNVTNGNSVALVLNGATAASTGSWLLNVVRAGCTSATVQVPVVINPIPTVTANNSGPVCPGASVQLFASNVLNGQYQWSGPGGFSSMVQNPVIASAIAGTYSVTVTQNGCTSAQATTTVVLNAVPATPTLNAVAALCEGQSFTVSTVAAAIAGATYTWSGPGGFTSVTIGANSITRTNATLAMSGLYSLTVTQNGCTSPLATTSVTVNPTPVALLTNNGPVCVGSPLTLTATSIPGAQYTFTAPSAATFGPQTSNVVNVAAATAVLGGTWSVTATLGTCVSAIATSTVTVNATPASPTPVSAAQTVCLGGTLSLTSTAVANATYQWLGPNGYTSNQQNPVKTGMTLADAGIYSVRVTVSGCTSAFATVTVTVTNLLSITLSNSGPVCSGTALALTATAGATSYSFTSPTGIITTQAGNTLNIASANATHNGVWTVTATSATCVSNPASTTVVVNTTPATPTPNSNTPICAGTTLQLFSPTVQGATYAWSGPSAFSSSVANPVRNSATVAMGGIYSLIVTVNGCPSAQATTTVTVNATPAPPNASTLAPTVCVGDVIDLVAGPLLTTGATYSWNGPNDYAQSFVAASPGPFTFSIFNVTQANSGVYTLNVTSNGCTSLGTNVQVTVNETPSSQFTPSAFTICGGETVVFTINTPNPNNFYFFDDAQGNSFAGTGPFVTTYPNAAVTQIFSTFLDAFDPTFTCGSTTVIPITVNPQPSAPTISSNSPVCSGGTLILTTSATINGATYNVTGPNGYSFTFTGTGAARTVTITNAQAVNAGAYTVSVIQSGCESVPSSLNVTINPAPVVSGVSGSTPICVGGTLNLTAPVVPGVTYAWTGPNGFNSAVQNPVINNVTAAASGTYSLVVTANGCPSAPAATVNIVVNSLAAVSAGSNSPVCVGNTLNLTSAPAGATYDWAGPGGFASSFQNPTLANVTTGNAGVYTVRVSVPGCGVQTMSINVSISVPPPANAANNSPICAGSNLFLTSTFIPGATYSWTGPNGFTSNLVNPSIPGATTAAAGLYILQISGGGICSTITLATNVIIDSPVTPPTITNNSPLCEGATLNLQTPTVTNGFYHWTGPAGFNSSVQNPSIASVTTANGGTYNLSVGILGSACPQASATANIVVRATPTAGPLTSNSPVCVGATLQLTSPFVAGASYAWTGPNTFTSAVQNPIIVNAGTVNSGTYSLTVTVNGCASAPATVTGLVTPAPSATASSNTPLCEGQNLQLTATNTVVGVTYQWTGPSGYASGPFAGTGANIIQTIANAVPASSGFYVLTATSACGTASTTINVLINPAPVVGAGNNGPLCPGSTLNLSSTFVAGATYSWTGPNNFVSTLQNPIRPFIGLTDAGIYQVVVTGPGCSPTSASTKVDIIQGVTVAAGNNSPVCTGGTISLSATFLAGATYFWVGPNGFNSVAVNPVIANASAANAGAYQVSVTVPGCPSPVSAQTNVTVNAVPVATATSNSPVCTGGMINLTAPFVAGASYAWTGPNGFTSAEQNPSIVNASAANAGVYQLSISNGPGCTPGTGSVSVSVTAPAVISAGNTGPVCVGGSLNLTASNIAGAAYSWSGPNGFTSNVQNPTINSATTNASGVYSVTASIAGCASITAATTVIVNGKPTPPSIATNIFICSGQTLTLTASPISGATYSWSGPSGFVSTQQNPTLSNATSVNQGSYFVTVNVNGCTSDAVFTVVTISPSIGTFAASSNGPVCTGQTLVLSATSIPSGTYSWTGPNGFTSTAQGPSIGSVTSLAAGVYAVTVTANGCTATANTPVTINATPASPTATNNGPVCAGSTLNLFASGLTGVTYQWTGPNGFTSTAQNPVIASSGTANSGTYAVTATANGCSSVLTTTVAIVNAVPSAPTASNNGPLCAGGTLNLAASNVAGASYMWSGPAGFTSASQSPSISGVTTANNGTYSVSATVNGCTSTFGVTSVVVNATPASPTANNNGPVCSGATLNLTASTVAGATYSWTGPNGFTSNTQNPTIPAATSLNGGTYNVVATIAGCSSLASATIAVVNATPAAVTATNSGPVCAGANLFLTATNVAGATYNWTGPNSFTSNAQTPVILAATSSATGVYSVTATVAGCTSTVSTTTAIVSAPPATPTLNSNSPLCSGGTLSLTAPFVAGATYMWSGPAGFSSTLQSPSIANATTANAGVYSLMVTVGGCGSGQATLNVVVNGVPASAIASNGGPICAGQNLTLSSTTVAGATYNWTGPNAFTSTAQNPVITSATTAASGTYNLTVTVAGCSSTATNTTAVVNAGPNAPTLTSNSPVCAGGTLIIGATTISGTTYNWSGPNGFTTTSQNPVISNASTLNSGVYSVTVTNNANGCVSSVATANVAVNAIPTGLTAGNNGPICAGSALTLSASTITGAVYAWIGPNGFSATTQNPSVASPVTGTYTVTAVVNGCGSAPATTSIVVNAIPSAPAVANNGPICAGQSLSLTAGLVAGATYAWTGPNGFSSTDQSPAIASVASTASGVYSLRVTVNGCTSSVTTTSALVNASPSAPTATNNGPVCSGNPINLTTPTVAGATYAWSGPGGFTSSAQNPVINNATATNGGTYNLVVTTSGCPSLPGSTNVTVIAVPSAPSVTNNGPLCEGQNLNLNAQSVAGGTYSWSGPNSFTSTLQNPTLTSVTTANAGNYFLNVTVSGCTVPTASTSVVINAVPQTPVAGNNGPICSGQTLVLSGSFVGAGVTYSWIGPNGFTSTQISPVIPNTTTLNAGTYFLTASKGGCATPVVQTTVNITQTPAIPTMGSNGPICSGSNLILSSNTVSGATYAWSGPNSFTSTTQNPNIAGATSLNAGVYSLTITRNGCTSDLGTTTVNVLALPTTPNASSNSPVCTGKVLSLTTDLVTGASYKWTGPASFASTLQNPTLNNITSSNAGVYSLTITTNGCTSAVATTTVTTVTSPATPIVFNTGPYCEGGFVELFTNSIANATYSWTGPNGYSSSDQNPTIFPAVAANTGFYSVTITLNGCTSPVASTKVDVIATPATPTITIPAAICDGQTLQFQASNVAGAAYTWFGPNGFNSFDQNPVILNVTSDNNGVYSVTTIVNGCVSVQGTVLVEVNPIPAAPTASNNGPICLNGSVTLSASDVAGGSFNWSGPASFASANQSSIVSPVGTANAGVYNVTVTVDGCTSAPASTTVALLPQSSATLVSGTQSICLNQTVTYNVVLSGVAPWSLSYSENGGPAQTVSGITASPYTLTATPTAAGTRTYTLVSLTDGNGCTGTNVSGSATANVSLNNNSSAVISGIASPICIGSTATFQVALTGASPWKITYTENNGLPTTVSGITASPYTLTVTPTGFGVRTFTITQVIDATTCAGATVGGTGTVETFPNTTSTAVLSGNQTNVCAAGTTTFTVTLTGVAPWQIQYSENGGPTQVVNGITASPYTLTVTPSGTTGNRTVTLTQVKDAAACGVGAISGQGTMFVVAATPISATISGSPSICLGQSTTLSVALTGTSPWTIQYSVNNGAPITVSGITASPFNLSVQPNGTGTFAYTLVGLSSANACASVTLGGVGTVTVNNAPSLTLQSATATDCGANGSLTVVAGGDTPPPFTYSIDGVNFTNTTGTFTGLAAGGYLVYAKGAGCVSAPISVIINGPQTPTILSATASATSPSNSIVVTWQAVGGAASYTLRYRVAGTTTFTVVNNITTTSSTVTGLLSSTTYEFSVQAVCPSGLSSAFSDLVSGATQAGGSSGGCSTPTGLAVNIQSPTAATFTWNGNVSGAVCYIVSVGPLSANPNVWPQFLIPHPGNTLTITTLLAGTEYGARIRTNCSLCSSLSGIRSAFTSNLVFTMPNGSKEGQVAQAAAITDLSVYPNPNRGAFSLRFDAETAGEVAIKVYDVTGRAVYDKVQAASAGSNDLPIDLTREAAGLYTLQFRQGETIRTVKVIVQ